jgi:hypothetical protein
MQHCTKQKLEKFSMTGSTPTTPTGLKDVVGTVFNLSETLHRRNKSQPNQDTDSPGKLLSTPILDDNAQFDSNEPASGIERTNSYLTKPAKNIQIQKRPSSKALANRTPTQRGTTPKTPRSSLFNQELHEMDEDATSPHLLNDHILTLEQLSTKYNKSGINVNDPEHSTGMSIHEADVLLQLHGANIHIPKEKSFLSKLCCLTTEKDRNGELPVSATVIREGVTKQILTREIVPGDICIVRAGQIVPADSRVIHAVDFHIESLLTNHEEIMLHEKPCFDGGLMDSHNICLGGTAVTKGTAVVIVIRTGRDLHIFSRLRY